LTEIGKVDTRFFAGSVASLPRGTEDAQQQSGPSTGESLTGIQPSLLKLVDEN